MSKSASDFLPIFALRLCDHPRMDPVSTRDILASNLRKLIERGTPPGERFSIRAWALGRGLDVKMIDRLVKGQHAVTLDKLEEIAAACNLKSWQLLVEDLDPEAPPDAPMTPDDRVMLKRLRRLLGE